MNKITLTEEELEAIIAERMAHKPITSASIFNSVSFDMTILEPINAKYPEVVEKLDNDTIQYNPNPLKAVFSNTPKVHENMNEKRYSKVYVGDLHNHIRLLVLNVFGKTQNKELTKDEYELAQNFYAELADWFVTKYEERLEALVAK